MASLQKTLEQQLLCQNSFKRRNKAAAARTRRGSCRYCRSLPPRAPPCRWRYVTGLVASRLIAFSCRRMCRFAGDPSRQRHEEYGEAQGPRQMAALMDHGIGLLSAPLFSPSPLDPHPSGRPAVLAALRSHSLTSHNGASLCAGGRAGGGRRGEGREVLPTVTSRGKFKTSAFRMDTDGRWNESHETELKVVEGNNCRKAWRGGG